MVKFNFNLVGYSFQHGLKVLEKSLAAALDGLLSLDATARGAVDTYDAHVAAGGARIGEWDDEGVKEWEQSDILAYEAEVAREAAEDLMKAYVLALYHHWERWALVWGRGAKMSNFKEMKIATLGRGYPIHPNLETLKDLTNALKHQKQDEGARAVAEWPDLTARGTQRIGGAIDWYTSIRVSKARMQSLFAIVAASGPTVDMLPRRDGEPT